MNVASLTKDVVYKENKPAITVLLKTKNIKEVRIAMKKGQSMKEHKAPFPIVIAVFEGVLNLGVNGKKTILKKGDLIALDANIPHDLSCIKDCIIRLSISTADSIERVKSIA
ncbi:cupin domain-containing protein [Aquimarina litoralis]|uniref:cupin domain-containing protein n=1 Tax=Aquimarina litoralis TaxID=584605 RepID=UPI001C55F7A0|nr:cupin domain-containing protein [Aquimarina litoralis]MBW1294421.1 cupin domain-containing protein [Aquimarina litoralis]